MRRREREADRNKDSGQHACRAVAVVSVSFGAQDRITKCIGEVGSRAVWASRTTSVFHGVMLDATAHFCNAARAGVTAWADSLPVISTLGPLCEALVTALQAVPAQSDARLEERTGG